VSRGVIEGWWCKVVFSRVSVVVVVGDVSKAVAVLMVVVQGCTQVIPLLFVVSKNVVVKAVLVGGGSMASKKGSVVTIIEWIGVLDYDMWGDPVEAHGLSCHRAFMGPFWVESNNSLDIPGGFHGVLKGQSSAVKGMMGIPSVLAMS
jgi:hypothetical protein